MILEPPHRAALGEHAADVRVIGLGPVGTVMAPARAALGQGGRSAAAGSAGTSRRAAASASGRRGPASRRGWSSPTVSPGAIPTRNGAA